MRLVACSEFFCRLLLASLWKNSSLCQKLRFRRKKFKRSYTAAVVLQNPRGQTWYDKIWYETMWLNGFAFKTLYLGATFYICLPVSVKGTQSWNDEHVCLVQGSPDTPSGPGPTRLGTNTDFAHRISRGASSLSGEWFGVGLIWRNAGGEKSLRTTCLGLKCVVQKEKKTWNALGEKIGEKWQNNKRHCGTMKKRIDAHSHTFAEIPEKECIRWEKNIRSNEIS